MMKVHAFVRENYVKVLQISKEQGKATFIVYIAKGSVL